MKKRIKIHGFLIFIALLCVAVFPKLFLRLEKSIYDPLYLVAGLIFLTAGFYLRICARGYKAENSDSSKRLVIGGPYSLTRNPMYLGIFFIALGVIFLGFQWWVLAVFLIFFTACYVRLMYQEEKKLTGFFGSEYINYKNNTPLFLPKLSSLFKKGVKENLIIKPEWIKKEISAIIPVLIILVGFNLWKILK